MKKGVQGRQIMKVIVLAGGNDQIHLIKSIREYYGKNTYVILIDYLDAPMAAPYADIHVQLSTLDKEAVLAYAKSQNIDLIITACTDQALVTMAYVAEQMNLKCYLTYRQSLELTNKELMKQKMVQAGICTARYELVESGAAVPEKLEFPLVVKPVDCNSSKGISKVNNIQEYQCAVMNAHRFSPTKQAIVEEYVEGTEYSVDAFVHRGKADVLLITETVKGYREEGKFVITQSIYEEAVCLELRERLRQIAQEICQEFHISEGPMIIQVIKRGDEIFVIEFSARTGGGNKAQLIEKITGVDILWELLKVMEKRAEPVNPKLSKSFVHMDYVYARRGIFKEVPDLNVLKQKEIIDDFFIYKSENSEIDKIEGSTARIMGFVISADTREHLLERQSMAEECINVLDDAGQDMMIRGIYR